MNRAERRSIPESSIHPGRGGFSLLEVMIAVMVLTCLTLSSILVAIPISRQNRINREITTANNEARRIIEVIQWAPLDTITSMFPSGAEIPVNSIYAGLLQNGKFVVTYDDPSEDPLRLQMSLSWDSPDLGHMSRTFYSARTR